MNLVSIIKSVVEAPSVLASKLDVVGDQPELPDHVGECVTCGGVFLRENSTGFSFCKLHENGECR